MNSRLIGTDVGLNMIADSGESVANTATKAAANANSLTSDYLTQSQQRAKQLLDLQAQVSAAEAQKTNNGLGETLTSVGKLLIQREQQKLADKQAKKLAQQKEQALLLKNETNVKLTSLYQNEPGVERYRSSAAGIINQAMQKGLPAADVVELMNKVNEVSNKRFDSQQELIYGDQDKIQAARTDQVSSTLQFKLAPTIATIANLPPTEQAKPHLDYAEQLIRETLADESLSPEQRYRISSSAIAGLTKAYGTKADAFAKLNTNLHQMSQYVNFMRQARAQFETDGNLDAYKSRQEYAAVTWGNYEKSIAQPGEAEKFRAELASNQQTIRRVEQEARETLGANLNISEQETQMLAKRMISNSAYITYVESSPEFKRSPSVQAAIRLAKRYQEYVQANAENVDWNAANGTKYAQLNLSIATNRAQLIERLARATAANRSGQATPEQQQELNFYQQSIQNMPELNFIIDQMVQKLTPQGGGKIDASELQKASALTEQGFVGVMNATVREQQTRQQTLYDRFPDLQQYGLLKPVNQITKEAFSEQKMIDERMEHYRQRIIQQSQQQQPQTYGQPSPFDSASTYGATVDARGLVRTAPRQRLNTVTVNGVKIATPVLAGSSAPVTSSYLSNRDGGKRKHAGIDFGQAASVHSVALVSGRVAYIGNDPKGYGGYIDIYGDNGYVYRYGHQGNFKLKPGQKVNAGDIVSTSDGSGVGAPHLHFEVHPNPKFNSVNGNWVYQPQFGVSATTDPLAHLQKLNANSSSVLAPRIVDTVVSREQPTAKVPTNAALYPQGGALLNNQVQFVGGQTRQATNVYNSQRPVRTGTIDWNIGDPNNISYDYNDDFGYAEVRKNPKLQKAITDAARQLRIPAVWIADIIRQETGAGMSHTKVHNGGRNYGLFGFGSDSFSDVSMAQMRRMDETQQLQLMVKYQLENGWLKHLQKRGGQASISEFWAIMRMGTNWRRQALADPVGFTRKRMNDTGKTWGDELQLLGKWAGRRYQIPGNNRRARNQAISTEEHASCTLCQQMVLSNSGILPHSHDIA